MKPTPRTALFRHNAAALLAGGIALALSLLVVRHYAFNWAHNDDLEALDWYRDVFITKSRSIWDTWAIRHGPHPMGLQALITFALYRTAGVSLMHELELIWLVVLGCALVAWLSVRRSINGRLAGILAPAILILIAFHPVQINHLTWGFEIGWFLLNFFLILNIYLLETKRFSATSAVLLVLAVASFCSAQSVALWLVAAAHCCLLPHDRLKIPSIVLLLIGLVADAIAIIHISGGEGGFVIRSLPDFVVYALAMFGGYFGRREIPVLVLAGIMSIAMAAGCLIWAVRVRRLDGPGRVVSVLILATTIDLLLFTKGRYQLGLPWSLSEFHMGPFLIPMLLAFAITGLLLCSGAHGKPIRLVAGLALMGAPLVSMVVAIPYMRIEGSQSQTQRAIAMHATCHPGYSTWLVENANATTGADFIIERVKPELLAMCSDKEPARARLLEREPAYFVQLGKNHTEVAAALSDLWEVYMTHFDLQRAFSDDPKILLEWAGNNARNGSQYAPEKLAAHAAVFNALSPAA